MKKHVLSALAMLLFLSVAATGLLATNDPGNNPVDMIETPEVRLTQESPEALYCKVELGDAVYSCWFCKCEELAGLIQLPEPQEPMLP